MRLTTLITSDQRRGGTSRRSSSHRPGLVFIRNTTKANGAILLDRLFCEVTTRVNVRNSACSRSRSCPRLSRATGNQLSSCVLIGRGRRIRMCGRVTAGLNLRGGSSRIIVLPDRFVGQFDLHGRRNQNVPSRPRNLTSVILVSRTRLLVARKGRKCSKGGRLCSVLHETQIIVTIFSRGRVVRSDRR